MNADHILSDSARDSFVEHAEAVLKQNFPNVDVSLYANSDGTVELEHISSDNPGGGVGTKALGYLCDLADKEGVTLVLGVANEGDDYTYDEEEEEGDDYEDRLVSWYERHGFEITPSLSDRVQMRREPNR